MFLCIGMSLCVFVSEGMNEANTVSTQYIWQMDSNDDTKYLTHEEIMRTNEHTHEGTMQLSNDLDDAATARVNNISGSVKFCHIGQEIDVDWYLGEVFADKPNAPFNFGESFYQAIIGLLSNLARNTNQEKRGVFADVTIQSGTVTAALKSPPPDSDLDICRVLLDLWVSCSDFKSNNWEGLHSRLLAGVEAKNRDKAKKLFNNLSYSQFYKDLFGGSKAAFVIKYGADDVRDAWISEYGYLSAKNRLVFDDSVFDRAKQALEPLIQNLYSGTAPGRALLLQCECAQAIVDEYCLRFLSFPDATNCMQAQAINKISNKRLTDFFAKTLQGNAYAYDLYNFCEEFPCDVKLKCYRCFSQEASKEIWNLGYDIKQGFSVMLRSNCSPTSEDPLMARLAASLKQTTLNGNLK